jgi:ABC-type antimicrobial peptide transport system permease subunit
MTIVGVAAEAGGPTTAESTAPLLYTPAADSDAVALVVRITGSGDLLQPVRPLAHSIDPNVVAKIQSVEASISDMIAEPRFVMILLTMFTALALALAAIGLYGVMAYSVSQRTREIGIRLALGATRGRIARPILAGGVWLALIGCAFGAAVSIWGTKVIESQLYGVAKHDATSMIAAFIVLVGAALVACVVPARRALAVDPMTAIRAD